VNKRICFVEKEAITFFGKGEAVARPRRGDFILTRNNSWTDKLIHIGQKLRYHGQDSKYT
jgi:hypothetical protein